jgi:hypothetical protein
MMRSQRSFHIRPQTVLPVRTLAVDTVDTVTSGRDCSPKGSALSPVRPRPRAAHRRASRTARPNALRLATRISLYSREASTPCAPASSARTVASYTFSGGDGKW